MRKTILIAAASVALVFAESADSLRAEIEKMTARLQELERKNTEISADVLKETQEEPQFFEKNDKKAQEDVKVLKYSSDKKDAFYSDDTTISVIRVKTMKKGDGEQIDTAVRTVVWGEIKKSGGWREKNSIGLSGGVGVGATALDMRPAKKFLADAESVPDSKLKNTGLSASLGKWGTAISNGGFGIGGFGNGVVAGGGGYRARADFVSKISDTAMFITFVNLSYGGFALGNGWQKGKNAFSLISFIGGGSYNIDVKKRKTKTSWEGTKASDGGALHLEPIIDGASSSFFAFDLQTNYIRSFMRWFHVGGEISGLFAVSRKGFYYDYGYFSFSPSVRVNFIFGWL